MCDVIYVNAPGSYIGGNQYLKGTLSKCFHHLITLLLREVAVQIGGVAGGRPVTQTRVIRSLPPGTAVDVDSGMTAGPTVSQIGATVTSLNVQ